MIQISPRAQVSSLADIEDSARGTSVFVDDDVKIDAFVKIKPAGGTGNVRIGKRSFLNSGVVIYSGNGVMIGEDVLIAANVTIAAVNHEYRLRTMKIIEQRFAPSKGGVVIEDDVWVGANSVLLDGAILRRGCVVGAGSVVGVELPPYSINVGSPVRTIAYRE